MFSSSRLNNKPRTDNSWLKGIQDKTLNKSFPVTIAERSHPNTEVKLSRADDTAGAILWESRSLPGFLFFETFEKCHFEERERREILMMTVCKNFSLRSK